MGKTPKKTALKVVYIVILVLVSIITLYPLVYTVSIAFSPKASQAQGVVPFSTSFSLKNFNYLMYDASGGFFNSVKNTVIVSVGVVLITIICCTLAAYVFSRFKFPMRKAMMLSILILQIFPSFIGMRAIFVIVNRLGGYNQLWALVLIYASGNIPYNTWLIKSYLDTIPKDLDEAARIDGANHFKVFGRVILPLLKPMLVFLAITTFTGPWLDFIYPKLVLKPNNYTLGPMLYNLLPSEATAANFSAFAAGALIVAVPFVIIFLVGQKAMVTGLGAGAVKG